MRKTLIAGVAALMLAAPALAETWDFVLTNSTAREIKTIEVSVAGAGKWLPNEIDSDVKKSSTIKPAGRTTIHFEKAETTCRYDIRATFVDDTTAVWTGFNVCDNSFIVLKTSAAGAPIFSAN